MPEILISDATGNHITHPREFGRGLQLNRPFAGRAYAGVADEFKPEWLIPEHEWPDRIADQTRAKARISDLIRYHQIPPKNQRQTNFCWANAPTHAAEIARVKQGQRYVSLSPASVACRENGFKDQGGWGLNALRRIANEGVTPSLMWPDTAIARQFDTQSTRDEAAKYRVTEWIELEPRNLNQLVSCLLHGWPVPVGYNWWSHEVLACDAQWIEGKIAILIRNSWGNWGDGFGFGTLQGSRMLPDDAVAVRVIKA